MVNDAVLDKVLFVTREAVNSDLLSDADSMAAGIEAAGWVRAVDGGHWYCPDEPSWSLLSSGYAPNLAVFQTEEDASVVFTTGLDLARRLDQSEDLHQHESGPGWPTWSRDDARWAEWTGLGPDWVMWDGGPTRISLNVQPAYQPSRHRSPPHLHFQIERLDTPTDGFPRTPIVHAMSPPQDHLSHAGISQEKSTCPKTSLMFFAVTQTLLSSQPSSREKSTAGCTLPRRNT
ncbi:hypothetical protein ACX80U_16435 [Arthrobacter sp. TmT3-37]